MIGMENLASPSKKRPRQRFGRAVAGLAALGLTLALTTGTAAAGGQIRIVAPAKTGYGQQVRFAGANRLTVRARSRAGQVSKSSRVLYVRRHVADKKHPPAPVQEPTPIVSPPVSEPGEAPTEPVAAPAPVPSPSPTPVAPETQPVSESTTPPPLPTLFQSSFNSFSGWYAQALPGRISLVSGSAYEGAGDARFEVRPGDVEPDTGSNRAELSGPTFNAGEDLYVRDAIRVPAANTFQGSWQIIQQLHETDWGGSPGIAVFLGADRSLTLGAGDGSPTFWHGPALAAERWYDLVYHVKLSSDPAVGFVEVWLDGVPQQLSNGQTKAFGPTIQTAHTYLKAGIYRGKASTGISVVEHDNVVVGTSLAAVMGA